MPASMLQSCCPCVRTVHGVSSEALLVLIFETISLVIYSADWQWTGVLVDRDTHCSTVFMPFKPSWRVRVYLRVLAGVYEAALPLKNRLRWIRDAERLFMSGSSASLPSWALENNWSPLIDRAHFSRALLQFFHLLR